MRIQKCSFFGLLRRSIFLIVFSVLVTTVFGQIDVCTFNIRYDTENDENNQWSLRKQSVVEYLGFEQADFFGLQEALLHQVMFVDSSLENYDWIGVGRDDGKQSGEFSPLFYDSQKWKLIEENTFWLSVTPDTPSKSWDAALPRICTYGYFENLNDSQKIWVFNTHYDHIGEVARVQSSKLILKMIRELAGDEPVILLGDFNVQPDSEVIATFLDGELKDTYDEAPNKFGQLGTFSGFDLMAIPDRRIDYIFISQNLTADFYEVESKVIDGRYLSDHFPVMVSVSRK